MATTMTPPSPVPDVFGAGVPRGKDRIPLPAAVQKADVGASLHGWELQRVTPVPAFDFVLSEFRHAATGAAFLHVDTEDEHNVRLLDLLLALRGLSGSRSVKGRA